MSGSIINGISDLIARHGGVGGLLQTLQQNGLGGAVQSWTGNGANQSVAPDELGNALDRGQVEASAQQSGLPVEEFLSLAAQYLPMLIDHATPNGQPPQDEPSSGGWMGLVQNFLGQRLR